MNSIVIISSLLLLAILSLFILPFAPIVNYTITFIASSALFLLTAYRLFKDEVPAKTLFALVIISVIVRIAFINSTPIGSDDIYRYMWDGKVQAHSINPYQYTPVDSTLDYLSTELLPAKVNHADMKTMYFPLSEWLFFIGYSLSGEKEWGYKILLLLSEVFSLYGLYLLFKRLQISLKFILLYALCPMLFYEYSLDAHADGFGLSLLIFALYFYFSERKILAFILLGFSLSIKPAALILLPVLFFTEKEWKTRFQILSIPILTVGVQFIPYTFSTNPFEALLTFTEHWTFNGFVFNVVNLYFSNNRPARITCLILLIISVFLLSISRKQLIDKIYFAVLLLLLFSPIVHPWYVGWLAALIPLARKWSGIVYVSTLCLTSFTYISYQLRGDWKEEPLQWLLEYLPVIILLIYELAKDSKYFKNSRFASA